MPTKEKLENLFLKCQQTQVERLTKCVKEERKISDTKYAPIIVWPIAKWVVSLIGVLITAYLVTKL